MNSISFIASNTEPVRADVYIAATQDISRSQLKAGLKTLRINDKNAKLSHILKGEETVCVEWIDSVCENIEAQDIALDILYEDDKVCVVNKAQGMVTHPGAGNMSGTLVNALLWHWGKQSIRIDTLEDTQSGLRSGIVHRLDKDTSGVIITAKDRITEVFLQEQFKKRITKKEYIAIVQGHPPQKKGVIKTNIMRSSRNRKLFTTTDDASKGKSAYTMYHCIAIYGNYSLLRIRIKTGRTHQIRVHLKHIGCPVLGDSLYGKKDTLFPEATLMLHAKRLGLHMPSHSKVSQARADTDCPLPDNNAPVFTAPTPTRFKRIIKALRSRFDRTNFTG